jgi:hypothetical protein
VNPPFFRLKRGRGVAEAQRSDAFFVGPGLPGQDFAQLEPYLPGSSTAGKIASSI